MYQLFVLLNISARQNMIISFLLPEKGRGQRAEEAEEALEQGRDLTPNGNWPITHYL
jgi:hypothetical protein